MAKLDLNVLDKQIASDDFIVVQFKGELDKTNVEDVRSVLTRFTSELKENNLILLLAWNFREEVVGNLRNSGFKGQFLYPLPGEPFIQ